ncbi:MAG: sensor histidine kinase [Acidothermaceae bacterium]
MAKQMSTIFSRRSRNRPAMTVVDVCVALAIALPGLHSVSRDGGPLTIGILLDLGLALPLIWRRRAPSVVFGVIATVALATWLGDKRIFAAVALLIAFYTVAAYEPRRRTIAAAIVLEFGVLLATLSWAGGGRVLLGFVFLSGLVTAAGFIGTNVRTRRAYLAALEDRNSRLEFERDQQAQLAAAAERARIARDMHDVVAHNLSVMIALADGASFTVDADPARASNAMAQVSATGRQALTEMRHLLGVLHDDQPAALHPQPGVADIDELLTQVRLTGLTGELISEGNHSAFPPGLQLAVYRLVQEALTNILKHAFDAHTATVRLSFTAKKVDVDVVDDGLVPASSSSTAEGFVNGSTSGHGIAGMRERVAVYGGTVEAGPDPVRGWRVRATFKLLQEIST